MPSFCSPGLQSNRFLADCFHYNTLLPLRTANKSQRKARSQAQVLSGYGSNDREQQFLVFNLTRFSIFMYLHDLSWNTALGQWYLYQTYPTLMKPSTPLIERVTCTLSTYKTVFLHNSSEEVQSVHLYSIISHISANEAMINYLRFTRHCPFSRCCSNRLTRMFYSLPKMINQLSLLLFSLFLFTI